MNSFVHPVGLWKFHRLRSWKVKFFVAREGTVGTYIGTVIDSYFSNLNQFRQDCGGCWTELDDSVSTVVKGLAKSYSDRAIDDSIEDDDQAIDLAQAFPHEIFRRSAPVSTSLECRACWIVLNRLKSFVRARDKTSDVTHYGRLVKKTMLNNGW